MPCTVGGDINIDLTKCTCNQEIADYVDNLLINIFLPVTLMPTRITSRSATLIDHLYYYEGTRHRDVSVKSGNFLEDISDHLPNYMILINSKNPLQKERPLVRLFSQKNLALFKRELQNVDWTSVYNASDINDSYRNFFDIFIKLHNRCFPLTKLSRKIAKDKPWITSALKKVVAKRIPCISSGSKLVIIMTNENIKVTKKCILKRHFRQKLLIIMNFSIPKPTLLKPYGHI